jgi:hypothetical protein
MRHPKIRLSTIALVVAAALAGVMLFRISERVQTAEDNLARMQEAAAKEAETIRVLRTEWDYLNRPDRLEALAREHLKMNGPGVQQVMTDSADLPPVPVPDATREVSMEPPAKPAAPAPARIEPRRDTDEFNILLDKLQPAAGDGE